MRNLLDESAPINVMPVRRIARVSVKEGHLWGFIGEWTGRISPTSFETERQGVAA
jgi:hypothetical protein